MKLAAVLLFATVLTGCATKSGDDFADVQREVAQRSGQHIQWRRDTAEDRAVDAAVDRMLAPGLTADRAVQIALLNNRSLQATYESLGVAQAQLVQAGLLRNPIFSGDVKFSGDGPHVELALVSNFLDVFLIPLRKDLASDALESAKLRVTGSVVDLATQVRVAFIDLQAKQQTLALRREIAQTTKASYDYAARLRAAGNITQLDLLNTEAMHEQSKQDVAQAERALAEAHERLNMLLGLWGNRAKWNATGALGDIPKVEVQVDTIEKSAVASSTDLARARLEIQTAARKLGVANAVGLVPEIEVGAAYEHESGGPHQLGPAFSVPLPLIDQGQGARAEAAAELQRARQEYYADAVDLRSIARVARIRLLDARNRALHEHDVILPLRKQITQETLLHYNAMQLDVSKLLDAKQAELQAQIDYVESLREYWTARAQCEELISGHSPGALMPAGGGS